MIALILAAGKGTRLSAFYSCGSKCMIPINGKPLIENTVENLSKCKGIKKICIVIRENEREIPLYFGTEYNNVPIEYYVQDANKAGIINAVYSVSDLLEGEDEEVIVNLGDEYYERIDYEKLIKIHKERESAVTPVVVYSEDKNKIKKNYTIDIIEEDEIVDAIEKPLEVFNNYVGTGILVVSKRLLKDFASYCNNDFLGKQLVDWIKFAIKIGRRCYVEKVDTRFSNLNYRKDLEEIYTVSYQKNIDSVLSKYKKIIELYPQRKAVEFEENSITYKELDEKSDLVALNIVKGQCIGIRCANPIEFVISIIAVLKGQGYYVLLKDNYSEETIDYIIKNLNVNIIISDNLSIDYIELKDEKGKVSCINESCNYIMASFLDDLKSFNIVPEKAILNTALSINDLAFSKVDSKYISFGIAEELLMESSLSFVYASLLYGQTLKVITRKLQTKNRDLISKLNEVDICNITCYMISNITDYVEKTQGIKLDTKMIISSGGKLKKEILHRFFKQCKLTTVINTYCIEGYFGICTAFTINKEIENHLDEIPIGKPIRNTRIYILDSNKKIIGIRKLGQIWVAGDGACVRILDDQKRENIEYSLDIINDRNIMFNANNEGYFGLEGNIYLS